MVAPEQRVLSTNSPGSLDGLFAYHVMKETAASSFVWDVSPVTTHWLADNADRLMNAPQLAALGYGLTHFSSQASTEEARGRLVEGMRQLRLRDPYPSDGVTFVHDPRQLMGVTLGCAIVRDELPPNRPLAAELAI